jgi:DNA-binding transcriptional LysR family regulator
LRAAVSGGIGLAITSQWMFEPELANGAVRAVPMDWALPPGDLWAVFPTSRQPEDLAVNFGPPQKVRVQ